MSALPLVPAPAELIFGEGSFAVSDLVGITVSDAAAKGVASRFREDLESWAGLVLPEPTVGGPLPGSVHLDLTGDADVADAAPLGAHSAGAHRLEVDAEGAVVRAESLDGLYRGSTSLVQLVATGGGSLPFLRIDDRAQRGWRGLSLDVVRYFLPLTEIRRVIDLVALYKGNVLHLHLTDNEGWRLELPEWPRLTQGAPGAPRASYSIAEVQALAAYAAERFVTLVPEIDLPGHAAAALRAYPELNPVDAGQLDGPFPVANLSPDSPAAWRFVEDALEAAAATTPGGFLHIGGDEAFGMDDDAHRRFVEHANRMARRLGKHPIGWQETSRTGIGADDIVQYWIDFIAQSGSTQDAPTDASSAERTTESASTGAASALPAETLALLSAQFVKAAADGARIVEKGARVIVSPNSRAYLDRPHSEASLDAAQEETRSSLGFPYYPGTPLRDYLEWNPADMLPGADPDAIVGVEAAIWGESIQDLSQFEALLVPRLPGVAEVAWGAAGTPDWNEYRERIAHHAPLWDRAGWNWFRADSVSWMTRTSALEPASS